VTTPQRSAELPDVPTLAELGIKGADVTTWYGLYVTGGTPKPIVDTLYAELQRVLKLPDVQARLKGLGGEVGALTIEQFNDLNRREFEAYGKLIRDAGIKVE
jgi:tripartite-type tricarboxylate transporter receptor subunit TctC